MTREDDLHLAALLARLLPEPAIATACLYLAKRSGNEQLYWSFMKDWLAAHPGGITYFLPAPLSVFAPEFLRAFLKANPALLVPWNARHGS